ncbi:hypothetical protein PUN28_010325 [Cardiocondyla obscurior]|uniref:Uncharacterized protein n=1 Tax=Cardiocondyla obscurior TaxID=286306 RepID=A0AAW2FN83_9HYME
MNKFTLIVISSLFFSRLRKIFSFTSFQFKASGLRHVVEISDPNVLFHLQDLAYNCCRGLLISVFYEKLIRDLLSGPGWKARYSTIRFGRLTLDVKRCTLVL